MIKNYFLLEEGNIKQFVSCDESEIQAYNSVYVETDLKSFDFNRDFNYRFENGEVIETQRSDSTYLLYKANKDYETSVSQLTSTIPQSEIATWIKQESEARAYLSDNTASTPLINSICEARGVTKEYLVNKIIEKADAYAIAIGSLTGQRQAKEKQITQGA